jgi:hypothetical protein
MPGHAPTICQKQQIAGRSDPIIRCCRDVYAGFFGEMRALSRFKGRDSRTGKRSVLQRIDSILI